MELLRLQCSPFGGRVGFHRQGINLAGLNPVAHRGIGQVVALDPGQTFESTGNHGRVPVAAIARNVKVLAGQPGGDKGLEFVSGHKYGQKSKHKIAPVLQARAAGLASPVRRRSAPSGGSAAHEVASVGAFYPLIL